MTVDEIVRKAAAIDGWMHETELEWLASAALDKKIIIEVGSWMGRSTKALAMASPGVVYAVDYWKGSKGGSDRTVWEFERIGDDALFAIFRKNVAGEIAADKVIPVKMESGEAVAALKEKLFGRFADMVFIDATHTYEELRKDIECYLPLLAPGGLLCGHDYAWPEVRRAVDEKFPNRKRGNGTIWFTEIGCTENAEEVRPFLKGGVS